MTKERTNDDDDCQAKRITHRDREVKTTKRKPCELSSQNCLLLYGTALSYFGSFVCQYHD